MHQDFDLAVAVVLSPPDLHVIRWLNFFVLQADMTILKQNNR